MKPGVPPDVDGPDVYEDPRWDTSRRLALDETGGKCAVCGKPTQTVHHSTPISRGGDHFDERNLLPLCPKHHAEAHRDISNRRTSDP